MTKEQLIQYLRVCADLADSPKDGIAHVAIVPLRLAVELLEGAVEPPRERVHYQLCDAHEGMSYFVTTPVGVYAAPMRTVCPICDPQSPNRSE